MSTIKISSLTELVALADPVELPVAYLGVTKKITARHIQDYVLGNLTVAGTTLGTNTSSQVIQLASDIVPTTDETYSLGSSVKKFKTVWVGTGSVYITDKTLGTNAELTVDNGVLQINGANQLQVGDLKFVNNNIESTEGATDIEIGLTVSTGKLKLQRDVVIDSTKTLTYNYAVGYQDGNQNPVEVLDQTKQVHTFADGTWELHDGVDGKVLHFVMLSGGSAEDIYVRVSHLRKIVGGQDTTVSNVLFRPFPYGGGTSFNTITTMVFANGAWHPSQGTVV